MEAPGSLGQSGDPPASDKDQKLCALEPAVSATSLPMQIYDGTSHYDAKWHVPLVHHINQATPPPQSLADDTGLYDHETGGQFMGGERPAVLSAPLWHKG